jgi:ABC-type glutathione transport system ATPase component
VSLSLDPGEAVALVGESGSGKTTLARIALGLLEPDSGWVKLDGRRLDSLSRAEFRRARRHAAGVPGRGRRAQSASHRWRAHAAGTGRTRCPGAAAGDPAARRRRPAARGAFLARLPHELSGGQRQRLTIARALAPQPRLLIADEPLSGADVSIRGQILNLLLDIKSSRGVAMLLIVHDIALARAFADRVAVMFKGAIVEAGPAEQVLGRPQHPYTRRLLAAVPSLPT